MWLYHKIKSQVAYGVFWDVYHFQNCGQCWSWRYEMKTVVTEWLKLWLFQDMAAILRENGSERFGVILHMIFGVILHTMKRTRQDKWDIYSNASNAARSKTWMIFFHYTVPVVSNLLCFRYLSVCFESDLFWLKHISLLWDPESTFWTTLFSTRWKYCRFTNWKSYPHLKIQRYGLFSLLFVLHPVGKK